MTNTESQTDQTIRRDYDACLAVGMSPYAASVQTAAANLTTRDAVCLSLARTRVDEN